MKDLLFIFVLFFLFIHIWKIFCFALLCLRVTPTMLGFYSWLCKQRSLLTVLRKLQECWGSNSRWPCARQAFFLLNYFPVYCKSSLNNSLMSSESDFYFYYSTFLYLYPSVMLKSQITRDFKIAKYQLSQAN